MDKQDINKMAKATLTGDEVVSSTTDPNFFSGLEILPNPDEVLRAIHQVDEVYQKISQDAHVMGETRSSRAGLLKHEIKIIPGGETAADKKALELCQQVFNNKPSDNMVWQDVLWNMSKAQYLGFVVHEIVWEKSGSYILPAKILDRKNNRFEFSPDGELLVKFRGKQKSEPIDMNRVLLTRHQPSAQNPYGLALFSSCFWPWTFKHAGFRSYTKFVSKYGLPWAIGKYPIGTGDSERDNLVQALQKMVEDAVAAIPDGNAVELIESKSGKESPQNSFIELCNKEMSKALTSQTMATEQGSNGSRAASQVAREKEESVDESQRVIVESTMNDLFALITKINVLGAKPPQFMFYEEDKAPSAWVDTLTKAKTIMQIPKEFAHQVTGIPLPTKGEEVLDKSATEIQQFKADEKSAVFHDACNQQMDHINSLLKTSKDLTEFREKLNNIEFTNDAQQGLYVSGLDYLTQGINERN